MPWEYKTVRAQREEFVLAAQQGGNFSALCREFGISRKTGYKWMRRAQNGEECDDRSRKPKQVSARTPEAIESKILAVRAEHPGWGARKSKIVLEKAGEQGVRTVNAVLHRHGCIDLEESRKRQAFQRFERAGCNELWQTDFKGEFLTQDGRYCYPLDIIDDHSRFALRIAAADTTDAHAQLQVWRYTSNMVRPHAALNMRCLGEVYVPSELRFPERILPFEYGGRFHVRKVNNWGYVHFGIDFQIYLSETMAGERIEFRPGKEEDVFVAYYRNFKIATFSTQNDALVNRHITRL